MERKARRHLLEPAGGKRRQARLAAALAKTPMRLAVLSRCLQRLLVEPLVEALIIKSPARRRELLTEGARVCRHAMRLRRLAIPPQFDDGKVVLPIGLNHGLKTQVAIVLATVLGELL